MHKLKLALLVLAIALVAAWYAFRPERLVLNHRVNEGFPAGGDPSSAQVLESGTFYGVVHPTAGTSIFLDTREAVDAAVAAGVKAGGAEVGQPADYGFMYQRGLTDPDGNVVDFGWMDPKAAEVGPEAFASHQA